MSVVLPVAVEGRAKTTPNRNWRLRELARLFAFLVVIVIPTSLLPAAEPPVVAVVIGQGGTPEYEQNFHQWADRWREAAALAKAEHVEIGRDKKDDPIRAQLEKLLASKAEGPHRYGSC